MQVFRAVSSKHSAPLARAAFRPAARRTLTKMGVSVRLEPLGASYPCV